MIALLATILIFPVSFGVYAFSQRMMAKHESRVGREISVGSFFAQTFSDAWIEFRSSHSIEYWVLFALQCSLIILFEVDVEYLLFIYVALNGFALAYFSRSKKSAVQKIENDRLETSYSIATVVAVLCLFGCFTLSKSTSLVHLPWVGIEFLFVIPFQLAGMILFSEAPFQNSNTRPGWVQSVRFYIWSMLCVKLFLGGGDYFIDLHLKTAVLYVACRLAGIYFPKFQQRDLLRVGILYLLPITGLVWLTVILYGVFESGGMNV
jgi:hypothetical protein